MSIDLLFFICSLPVIRKRTRNWGQPCAREFKRSIPVVLKVGGIAPLGSILRGKGRKKQRVR